MIADYYPPGYTEPDYDFQCDYCHGKIDERELVQEPRCFGATIEYDYHFECYNEYRSVSRDCDRHLRQHGEKFFANSK